MTMAMRVKELIAQLQQQEQPEMWAMFNLDGDLYHIDAVHLIPDGYGGEVIALRPEPDDEFREGLHEPRPEPYCNHDPAAIDHGVCECGAVWNPSTRGWDNERTAETDNSDGWLE